VRFSTENGCSGMCYTVHTCENAKASVYSDDSRPTRDETL